MKMHILQRVISMLLVLCMVTLPLCTDTVYATGEDSQEVTQEMTPVANLETNVKAQLDAADAVVDNGANAQSTITATLHNAGVAGDATESVTLTENGLDGEGNALKLENIARGANLLEIRWTFPANQSHTLDITVPVGLYIVDQSWTTKEIAGSESLLQDPVFTPYDLDPDTAGLQQNTGTLFNAQTGTLTYTTTAVPDTNMDREEYITLFVGVDVKLWDKGDVDTQSSKGGALVAEAINGSTNNAITITDGTATRILSDAYTLDKVPADFEARSSKDSGSKLVSDSAELQNPIQFAFYDQDYTKYEWAYKEIRATYTVTYVDTNGNAQTIPVKGVTIPTEKRPGAVVSNIAQYGSLSFDEATQTAVVTDYYTEAVEMMVIGEPQFIVDASLNIPHDGLIRVAADITLISYNGSERSVSGVYTNATYKSKVAYEIEFKNTNSGTQYTAEDAWYGDTTDVIDYLGTLTFRNDGIGAIPAGMQVDVVFDTTYSATVTNAITTAINNSEDITDGVAVTAPNMLVSSFRLFSLGKGKISNITVEYIEQNGEDWVAKRTTVDVTAVQSNTTHGALLCLGTGKYMTKVSYTMPEIPGDTWLYRSGSPARDESGGTFHGRMLTADTDDPVVSQLTLTVPNDAKNYSLTTKTQVRALEEVKYIGYLNAAEGLSAKAGSDISLDMTLSAYDYGYTSSTYVPNPTIFAVLPKGITVTGASYAHKSNKSDISTAGISITPWTHTDGNVVYKIDLGTGAAFGGFRVPATSAAKLGFKDDQYCYVQLDLHLSASLRASSYNLQELLTLTTKIPTKELYSTYGQASGSNATVARYAKSYTHGVVDGDATAYTFSSLANNELTQLQIIPRTNGITFTPAVSETGKGDWRIGTSNTAAITVAPGDTYFYRVTAKNNSDEGVPQPNTALYIPIAHQNNTLPEAMGGATTVTFGVRLTGPVVVTDGATAGAWDIRYAFEITATENNKYFSNGVADFTGDGVTYAQWYTAEQINSDPNLYWEEVLCIKAVVSESYINANGENAYPKDASDTFTMELRMIPGVVGESLNYASATWNLYDSAGTTPAGGVLFNTAFTKVIRGKREEVREVSLGNYEDPESGVSDSIVEKLENYAGVVFHITSVTKSNVTLQTKAEIEYNKQDNNRLPERVVQDATFGITMGLNSIPTIDLAEATAGDTLEASKNYDDNTLQLDLSYYEVCLDPSTPRYVDVTISDPDSSVVITYRVRILRILSDQVAATGIAAGFYPNGGFGSPTTATGAYDGVVTMQFVCTFDNDYKYTTEESTKDYFIFVLDRWAVENNRARIPDGTPMTLIDMTKPENPQYYYYHYKSTDGWTVPATKFTKMLDPTVHYEQPEPTGQTINFVLMINFKDHNAYDYPSQDHDVNNNGIYGFGIKEGGTGGYYPTDPLMLTTERMSASGMEIDPIGTMTDGQMQLQATLSSKVYSGNTQYQMVDSDANHLWMGRSESIKVKLRQHSLDANGDYKKDDKGAYVYTDFLFPAGSYLTDGVNIYPACPGGGYIKVPISNVSTMPGGTTSMELTLHVPLASNLLVDNNEVKLYAGYMLAAPYRTIGTACGYTGKGLDANEFTKEFTPDEALRVVGDDHLITKDDPATTDDSTATFTVQRTDGATELSWDAYLKTASGYTTPAKYSQAAFSVENGTFDIDASTWAAGTYVVQFTASSGETSYYTLIVLE